MVMTIAFLDLGGIRCPNACFFFFFFFFFFLSYILMYT